MKYFLTIIGLTLLLASCQREPVEMIEANTPVINPPQLPVTGGLIGIINTEDQNAVSDAIVTLPGHQTTTDEFGRFSFENITLHADGSYLTIEKPGLHVGSRKFYAIEGETNIVQIEMERLEFDTNFDSNNDEVINSEYLEFNIPASSYLDETNESYSGQVKIDVLEYPAGSNGNSFKLPGDLTGLDQNFDLKSISNFGVFKFHITSQSEDKLQFPTDHTVSFRFEVPDADFLDIPNVVSLWNFNEENGTWLELGQATLNYGSFTGEINHSGYWMLGLAYDYADIKGSIESMNQAFPNTRMDVQNMEIGYLTSSHATRSGMYSLRVPQDVNLDMAIFHECNVGRQVENLGTFNESQELGPIVIDEVMDNISISGKITDCFGVNTTMPYLKVNFGEDQYMYRSDEFGNFDFSYSNCTEDEVSIVAINDQSSRVSESLVLPVHNVIELGEIQTCEGVVAGFDISYENMDWAENLESSVTHSWTVSRVATIDDKIIFSAKMIDQITSELYLNAAFVFVDGETTAEYALNFKTQGGFSIFGECEFEELDHGAFSSYRFFGQDSEVENIDINIFPNGINEINFDLVYYD